MRFLGFRFRELDADRFYELPLLSRPLRNLALSRYITVLGVLLGGELVLPRRFILEIMLIVLIF